MKAIRTTLITCALLLLAGCVTATYRPSAAQNETTEMAPLYPAENYLVTEPIVPQRSITQVGRFNSNLIFLADQLERNVDRKNLSNTFIVTSFTNLNNLSETSSLGRLIAENIIHELQVRKWQVFEVRLTRDITVNDTGEFSLSRDISKLKELYKIGGIVTGTYSVANGNIVVNSRVVDINTGIVMSSAQTYLPANYFTDSLLFNENNLKTMKIVGEGRDVKILTH